MNPADLFAFEAFLFDMDGTLADNMPYHHQTWFQWARQEGLNLSDEEILAQTHGTIREITARFFPDKSAQEQFEIGERKEALYREIYAPHLELLPGLSELLEAAKERGVKLAVTTAGDLNNVRFLTEGTQIRHLFDVVVASNDVQHGKPHPEVFLMAAEKLGIAPEKCLVFEDSPEGAEAARRGGMKAVLVNQSKPTEKFGDTEHVVQWMRDYRELNLG